MGRWTPVIIEAASLSRNTIGPATSSSVAQRPSGICFKKGSATCGWLQWPDEIGVITTVGFTLLTRMLYLPNSSAEQRVMFSSAALDEPQEMCPSSATSAA